MSTYRRERNTRLPGCLNSLVVFCHWLHPRSADARYVADNKVELSDERMMGEEVVGREIVEEGWEEAAVE